MRDIARVLLLVCLSFVAVPALANPEAIVTPLVAKDLPEFQGKEGVMILVEYPPGASDPIHRHNAHAFVYVLEGSIVMQLRDAAEITLSPGQTFYEGPNDVHIVGRNASNTQPAKFVVFLVKNQGAPILGRLQRQDLVALGDVDLLYFSSVDTGSPILKGLKS